MPAIFTSHSEFREWFAMPLSSSMAEGGNTSDPANADNVMLNADIVNRLHNVLRPFLLRRFVCLFRLWNLFRFFFPFFFCFVLFMFFFFRLKADVEKQLPKKYEHVVFCPLSTRQRFLYEVLV
jgi:E1A-binding protein p400